ncbi:MAG: hypothetical protein ACE5EL_07415, partial [Anaerolineae bacterium]
MMAGLAAAASGCGRLHEELPDDVVASPEVIDVVAPGRATAVARTAAAAAPIGRHGAPAGAGAKGPKATTALEGAPGSGIDEASAA